MRRITLPLNPCEADHVPRVGGVIGVTHDTIRSAVCAGKERVNPR
ncbi:MAG: hypothetical protein AAFX94_10415 [Myxococcota bacterium]